MLMPYLEILRVFLRLGLTSFGGPVAHIGYFHDEFVVRRRWLSDAQFGSSLAICQALPGPASSQLGFLIGLHRGGWGGALLAWIGFTLPSAFVLGLMALYGLQLQADWQALIVHGLKLVAVVVVAQAVWNMFGSLCRETVTRLLAIAGFAVALTLSGWVGQIGAMLIGALVGFAAYKQPAGRVPTVAALDHVPSRRLGIWLLLAMLGLLIFTPWFAIQQPALQMFDAFYRAGALVFGGGHVVLPLLETATVMPGLVSQDNFLTGYGLAQAMPGPLFTFAAWLGALDPGLPGSTGASLALIAIFLPGLLLVTGVLPWWQQLSHTSKAISILAGINAAVVGVLAAAWVSPIVSSSVSEPTDVIVAGIGAGLLLWRKCPVWLVVLTLPVLVLLFDWIGL